MEYLNYGFLESLKDRMVFSPKYESQMKLLPNKVHVVVLGNEAPDETKMTADRYNYFHAQPLPDTDDEQEEDESEEEDEENEADDEPTEE